MKRLLITGSSGLLGSNFNLYIGKKYDTYGIYKTIPNPEIKSQFKIDLSSNEQTQKIIDKIKPDLIVHCAALTNVDLCETDHDLAYRNNVLSTLNIIESIPMDIRFIYISTDCLFNGEKGSYKEDDSPSPLNYYAQTKLEGELFVEQKLKNYVILRTTMVGLNRVKGESFAEWIIKNLEDHQSIGMFYDVKFSPLFIDTLSYYIDNLLNLKFVGKINIAACSTLSKYEFGVRLAKGLGKDFSLVKSISVDECNLKAKRPKNMSLDTSLATSIFGTMPTAETEIKKLANQVLKKVMVS